MFDLAVLPFADKATPAPLSEAFAVVRDALAPAMPGDPGCYAELAWARLHGLATSTRAGRLPGSGAAGRLALAIDLLAPHGPGLT